MISVLLVDDHELVRTGIKRLLSDVQGIKVEAEAETGEAAIEQIRRKKPDVVLMDVSMPGIGGMEATRKISVTYPEVKVIVLTIHADDPYPTRLMKAGAMGYLTKGCSVGEMVTAITQVHEGQRYVAPQIAQSMALARLPGGESLLDKLSQRELQILLMLVKGDRSQEISEKLHLSPKTISTYRYRLYEKLGVHSDAELTRLAIRHGLLEGLD